MNIIFSSLLFNAILLIECYFKLKKIIIVASLRRTDLFLTVVVVIVYDFAVLFLLAYPRHATITIAVAGRSEYHCNDDDSNFRGL